MPSSPSLPARIAVSACLTVGLAAAIELLVLIARPDVFPIATDAGLFDPRRFGDTPGWRPQARGTSFGIAVQIDPRGCRALPPPREPVTTRWLVLGDSVTFGVGVEADQTFAARLQASRAGLEVLDTAVIGYGAGNYGPVLEGFLHEQPDLDQVLLFLTLNDVAWDLTADDVLHQGRGDLPPTVRVRDWLGEHVRTYQLLKGTFADRSLHHHRRDAAWYEAGDEHFERMVRLVGELAATVGRAGLPLRVFALPNEAQLRATGDGAPQDLLVAHLARRGVAAESLVGPLRAAVGGDSRSFYLFADSMHFTPRGHAAVADAVIASLERAREP